MPCGLSCLVAELPFSSSPPFEILFKHQEPAQTLIPAPQPKGQSLPSELHSSLNIMYIYSEVPGL